MNVQCTSKLQRFHLSLIFTLTIAITAPSVFAATFDAAIDILPMRSSVQKISPQIMHPEPGRWVSPGTHDSAALPTPAPPVLIAKAILDHRQPAFTPKSGCRSSGGTLHRRGAIHTQFTHFDPRHGSVDNLSVD